MENQCGHNTTMNLYASDIGGISLWWCTNCGAVNTHIMLPGGKWKAGVWYIPIMAQTSPSSKVSASEDIKR